MNTYTFAYYGWVPGYDDFDIDWFDVTANTLEDAMEIIKTYKWLMAKHGPDLVAVNGKDLNDHMTRLAVLN